MCPTFPLGRSFGCTSAIFIISFPQRLFWHPKSPLKNNSNNKKLNRMCAGPNGEEKPWHEKDLELFMASSALTTQVYHDALIQLLAMTTLFYLTISTTALERPSVISMPRHARILPFSLTNAYTTVAFPRFIIHIWRRCKRSVLLCYHFIKTRSSHFSLSFFNCTAPRRKHFVFLCRKSRSFHLFR